MYTSQYYIVWTMTLKLFMGQKCAPIGGDPHIYMKKFHTILVSVQAKNMVGKKQSNPH